ncbi:MAG: hypothetical protein P8Y53_17715 [Pseudolabrys sp.]
MRQAFFALAAAGLLATAAPQAAQAHCRGCGVAAGVIGGLAAGAIIGSAVANSRPAYAEPVYVEPPPRRVYYEDEPVCHRVRERVWIRGFGWRWRRVRVCD